MFCCIIIVARNFSKLSSIIKVGISSNLTFKICKFPVWMYFCCFSFSFFFFLKRKRQQLRVLLNLNHVINTSDLVSEKYYIILVAWTKPKNSGYKFYPHEIVIWNAIAIVNFLFLFQFFWFLNNYNAISACKFTCENNAKISI